MLFRAWLLYCRLSLHCYSSEAVQDSNLSGIGLQETSKPLQTVFFIRPFELVVLPQETGETGTPV